MFVCCCEDIGVFVAVSTLVCLWLLGAYWCVCSSCEDNIVFV